MTDHDTARTIFTAARIQARRAAPDAPDDRIDAGAGVMLAQLVEALVRLNHQRWAWSLRTSYGHFSTMQTDVFADPVDPANRHPLSEAHEDASKLLLALGLPPVNI